MAAPNVQQGFPVQELVDMIDEATAAAKEKLRKLQENAGDQVSITAMFEMQMTMNVLSQLSELGTSVVAAADAAVKSSARTMRQ